MVGGSGGRARFAGGNGVSVAAGVAATAGQRSAACVGGGESVECSAYNWLGTWWVDEWVAGTMVGRQAVNAMNAVHRH